MMPELLKVNNCVNWWERMYHHDLIKHKFADTTNSSGKTEAGSSQAAAFLQNFVE